MSEWDDDEVVAYADDYGDGNGNTTVEFEVSDDFDWNAFVEDAQKVPGFKDMKAIGIDSFHLDSEAIGDTILIIGKDAKMKFSFAFNDESLCLEFEDLPESVLRIGQKVDSYDTLVDFMNAYFESWSR